MQHNDVIVNIDNVVVGRFVGYIAGSVNSYEVSIGEGDNKLTYSFTGNNAGLLQYVSKLIEQHNKRAEKEGGMLI